VVGVYAYNNNPFHLLLVFIFGVLGYFLNKMEYSSAPLILGLILGNLADSSFRRALFLHHGALWRLINRPLSFIFFAACVLTILSQTKVMHHVKKMFVKK
ncbi:MAG TPA: transporter, partial [Firmicutes bacterium]|nr:transporter [Bacillota bacterium]